MTDEQPLSQQDLDDLAAMLSSQDVPDIPDAYVTIYLVGGQTINLANYDAAKLVRSISENPIVELVDSQHTRVYLFHSHVSAVAALSRQEVERQVRERNGG